MGGHYSAMLGYTGQETTWANEMIIGINHAPCAGSIAVPIDLQSKRANTVLRLPPISNHCACIEYINPSLMPSG